ncbi:unnamed protein product [Paramecium pentaurelia]|uniref:Uncharacterized protein n=1 Tax=Paramecium pentaurelia TaxID=43138 RepID=A0A8S1SIJ6_9CILI|nr:unnamed protein product [Paramecium pentaurelia]
MVKASQVISDWVKGALEQQFGLKKILPEQKVLMKTEDFQHKKDKKYRKQNIQEKLFLDRNQQQQFKYNATSFIYMKYTIKIGITQFSFEMEFGVAKNRCQLIGQI